MFDPTVFDNLKVGIENYVYDADTLDELVTVTGRKDLLDLASMSRDFQLSFEQRGIEDIWAMWRLTTNVDELANEILEKKGSNPQCELTVHFYFGQERSEVWTRRVMREIKHIWGHEVLLEQTYQIKMKEDQYMHSNEFIVRFDRGINEEQMNDVGELFDYTLLTISRLKNLT